MTMGLSAADGVEEANSEDGRWVCGSKEEMSEASSASGAFGRYFRGAADLAERLYGEGYRNHAYVIACSALDALSAIWASDFRDELESCRDAVRFRRFTEKFLDDPDRFRVAVVFFAEDLMKYGPASLRETARLMLEDRVALRGVAAMNFGEWPHQYKDRSWEALLEEVPALAGDDRLAALAQWYTYPAVVYSLFRCGVVHGLQKGTRTNDFSPPEGDDEVMYAPELFFGDRERPLSVKFGIKVVTRWIREAVGNYEAHCRERGRVPGASYDASAKSLKVLERAWHDAYKGKGS